MPVPVDFDAVADELYSLPPEEFTATRSAREKQAKAAGDADLAGRLRTLVKPNAVGWLANQLVREHPKEIQPLIELGDDLRAAMKQGSGSRLRELSRLQRQLISSLVEEARHAANDAGRTVSADTARGLADTLRAVLADGGAADEFLAGRLTGGLFRSGLDGDDSTEPATAPVPAPSRRSGRPKTVPKAVSTTPPKTPSKTPPKTPPKTGDRTVRRSAELTADEDRARQLAVTAGKAKEQARAAAVEAEQAAAHATETVDRLQSELDEARKAQADAERALRRMRADLDKAERAERLAEHGLTVAADRRKD